MNRRYEFVAARANRRCEYCRADEGLINCAFHVEHVKPSSKGGSNDESNLALACFACNLFKSDHTDGVDPKTGEHQPLFNPRQDVWHEHFEFDSESAHMLGLTPVGRATILRLRLNASRQINARKQWIEAGKFP